MYPLVSVCIPNYNYESFIDSCINSVLKQSYQNIEIIFVDDCSEDNSFAKAQKYSKYVKVFKNDSNVGMVGNYNICAKYATGKYILFLSTDDCLNTDFVLRSIDVMEAHNDVGIVICEREEIAADGQALEPLPFFYDRSCIIPSRSQLPVMMMTGIGVSCQVTMRRSIFESAGRFSERFSHAFDWHSNFKCVLRSNMAYIHERLVRYRVFQGNSTAAMTRNLGMSLEHYLLLLELKNLAQRNGFPEAARRYPEAVEKLAMMCLRYCTNMLADNEIDVAKRYLHLARAYSPAINSTPFFIALDNRLRGVSSQTDFERQMKQPGCNTRRVKSYPPPEGFFNL